MTYKTEFPDFPEAEWPAMPEGFTDTSWHNDVCPNITNEALGIGIFIDYADEERREIEETAGRYTAYNLDRDGMPNDAGLTTDNWDEILTFVDRARAIKAAGIYVLHDDSEPRCGRIYHVMVGNTRVGIAYDSLELQTVIDHAIEKPLKGI